MSVTKLAQPVRTPLEVVDETWDDETFHVTVRIPADRAFRLPSAISYEGVVLGFLAYSVSQGVALYTTTFPLAQSLGDCMN